MTRDYDPTPTPGETMMATSRAIATLVDRVRPLFAGHPPELIGAVLDELVATWLLGHVIPQDAKATENIQSEMLDIHIGNVRHLATENAKTLNVFPNQLSPLGEKAVELTRALEAWRRPDESANKIVAALQGYLDAWREASRM